MTKLYALTWKQAAAAVVCAIALGCAHAGASRDVQGKASSQVEKEQPGKSLQARGESALRRMAEANEYWLTAPPAAVRNYAYNHGRGGNTRHFEVSNPRSADADVRCGVTYKTGLGALAKDPSQAVIVDMGEEAGKMRIDFRLKEMFKGGCGNGLQGSWYGYFNLGVTGGSLWLDAERMVPLELRTGNMTEEFDQYVKVAEGRYAPLNIRIRKGDQKESMRFDWLFRVYEPGLWLFDAARYAPGGGEPQVVAMVTDVVVNGAGGKDAATTSVSTPVMAESPEARMLRDAQGRGQHRAQETVAANRAWLLPPLKLRRGLAYDYRQEGLYRERVWFDDEGRILVQLAAPKEGPETPTRQYLFLPEGTKVVADLGQPYVSESEIKGEGGFEGTEPLHRDRNVQNLAVGLGWDCALTRFARDPAPFLVEEKRDQKGDTYDLILTSVGGDTRLFTGTMLTYTSWAYMHDVRYDRSEITCDARMHRPLEERDYNGDKLVGRYTFSNYIESEGGAAPGQIVAVIPFEKDGKDTSLEMTAAFRFASPGVWLLDRVHSAFRGDDAGSTGTVTLAEAGAVDAAPVREALTRLEATRTLRDQLAAAPEGPQTVRFALGESIPLFAAAQWKLDKEGQAIAVREVRIDKGDGGKLLLTAGLLSNAYWKEYEVELTANLLDAAGKRLGGGQTKAPVRAEGIMSDTPVVLELPDLPNDLALVKSVSVGLSVERMTGQYHGHGIWMRNSFP